MFSLWLSLALADDPHTLTVRVEGFPDDVGVAVVRLYVPGQDVTEPDCAASQVASIADGTATVRFVASPDGPIALVAFHDRDADGQLGHGLLGPTESVGFSGGYTFSLLGGLPRFEALAVTPGEEAVVVPLSVLR